MNIISKKFWSEGVGSILLIILFAFSIRWLLVEAYVIPSGSMLPSLLVGDHIFVNKLKFGVRVPFSESWFIKFKGPKRGDVIVFKDPEKLEKFYIKRVVGLPGDKIYYEGGNLYINDELVPKSVPSENLGDWKWMRDEDMHQGPGALERYNHWEEKLGERNYSVILPKQTFLEPEAGPYFVPDGHYFMMGDNRANSKDSRRWDPDKRFVPFDYLVGQAMFVWLSCERKGQSAIYFLPICNPMKVRGSRFFHSVH